MNTNFEQIFPLGKKKTMIFKENFTLTNGVKIPKLELGYRHFDTAQAYGNEVICCEL